MFLPYLMGERSPLLDEKARGAFIGLSGGHGRGHLIRAVLEGVTYSQRQCVDVLRGMNVPTEEMMACGGGARSAFWRQMLADVYGCPIQTAKAALEGPALGVAILAGVGTGVYPSVESACDAIVKPDTVLYPDAECGRVYGSLLPALSAAISRAAGDLPCPGRHEEPGMSGAKRILPLLAVLCFALFLLYGVYFNAFGANAESMMAFFGITESRQGFVMTIQSLGGIVMTVLLGLFGERLHKLYGLLAGAVLVGVAGVTIGTMPLYGNDSYGLLLVFALIGGVGYITIDLLMNGVIADVFPEKKSTLLPIVHGFYGLGAMLAPLLVTWLTDSGSPATFAVPYLVLGAAALVLGAVFWAVSRRATPHTPYADMTALRDRSVANPAEIFRDKRAWLYLLCCFLYLCFQNGIAVWLPNYYKTVHHMAGGAANAMLTLFFLGALVVRMLSPLVYKRMPVRTFYLLTCFLSAGVFAVLLLTPSLAVQRVLLVLLGLLQGAEVPALVILCCETFPTRTASASSIIVLGVSLSALIAPTVLGRLIEQVGYGIPLWGLTACLPLSAAVLLAIRRDAPARA